MTPYLVSEWEIAETSLAPERLAAAESVFAVANGYLGLRGTPEEGAPAHDPGALLNGFHETWPIVYPEDAYGLARTGQTIVNATDGSIIRLFVDDEPFDLATAVVVRCERVLDLAAGVLRREVEFETPRGRRILIRSRRLASLEHRHLAAMDYEVTALDGPARIAVSSELVTHGPTDASDDPRRGNGFAEQVLVPLGSRADERRAVVRLATRRSGLALACGMDHAVEAPGRVGVRARAEGDGAQVVFLTELETGQTLRLSKFVAYHWGAKAASGDLAARAGRTLDRAAADGYDQVEAAHRVHVDAFWRRSDVELEGAPELQQAVRFNLFSLMQATARAEGLGVPAKGLTGRGYEGHYFWDTEIYVVPFLIHTSPDWARQVLAFRCGMVEAARRRARDVGHHGALFPLRRRPGRREREPRRRRPHRVVRRHVAGAGGRVRRAARLRRPDRLLPTAARRLDAAALPRGRARPGGRGRDDPVRHDLPAARGHRADGRPLRRAAAHRAGAPVRCAVLPDTDDLPLAA